MSSSGDVNRIHSAQDLSVERLENTDISFIIFSFLDAVGYTAATQACKRVNKSHILEDIHTYCITTTYTSLLYLTQLQQLLLHLH